MVQSVPSRFVLDVVTPTETHVDVTEIIFAGLGVSVTDEGGGSIKARILGGSGTGVRRIDSSLQGAMDPFVLTGPSAYDVASVFRFPGTDQEGAPDSFQVIAFRNGASGTYDLRLWDVTNSLTIAEKTGNSETTSTMIDIGTLSNLPTGPAIFEVQGKKAKLQYYALEWGTV